MKIYIQSKHEHSERTFAKFETANVNKSKIQTAICVIHLNANLEQY
jgi:hypothetical protein